MAHALPSVTLTDNRRQADPVERALLAELRDGDVTKALAGLDQLNRLQRFSDPVEAKRRLVTDWLTARQRGGMVIMTALHRHDVDDLNDLARQHFNAQGHLTGPELQIEDRSFAVGDRVMALRNRYDLGLVNGDTASVTEIHEQRGDLTVTLDRGGRRSVPADYLADGDLTHGYAITVHKAQGLTADEAFVYSDSAVYREAGYTALSRARDATHIYHVDDDPDIDLAQLLSRSRDKTLAESLFAKRCTNHELQRDFAVEL